MVAPWAMRRMDAACWAASSASGVGVVVAELEVPGLGMVVARLRSVVVLVVLRSVVVLVVVRMLTAGGSCGAA